HGSTASSSGPDSRATAAIFSAQLMQTPARSIPQPDGVAPSQSESDYRTCQRAPLRSVTSGSSAQLPINFSDAVSGDFYLRSGRCGGAPEEIRTPDPQIRSLVH